MPIIVDIAHLEGHKEEFPLHDASSIVYDSGTDTSVKDAIDALGAPVSGGITHGRNVGAVTAIGQLVYFSTGTGLLELGVGNSTFEIQDVYMVKALPNGSDALVTKTGLISSLSGLIPGSYYYLSTSVVGALTTIPPAMASGLWLRPIGQAFTATVMRLNLERDSTFRSV